MTSSTSHIDGADDIGRDVKEVAGSVDPVS
jgi:hypothetical protein